MSTTKMYAPVERERRTRVLALAAAGEIPSAERTFVRTVAAVLEGLALIGAVDGSRAYDDCAADAFRLRRALDEPTPLLVLETAALGIYANETDTAREYLRSRRPEEPASDAAWDEWVLGNLLRTWWLLLCNDDAKEVLRIVSGLSEEQRNREQAFLDGFQEGQDRALVARRLLALYHWAQATHDIASWRLDGGSEEFASNATRHLQQAFALATDVELAHLLGWLQVITFRPDVP